MSSFIQRFLILSAIIGSCISGAHADEGFDAWLREFKREAQEQGISAQTLEEAFTTTEFLDDVIELDRKQPESKLTLAQYLDKVVNDVRIEKGRELYQEHKELLEQISATYGVQPQYIVALWGIETNFGDNTGGYQVVDALATLAYDGRRSEFFRGELLKALQIIDADHITAFDMQGSWAGAMGQCQFMPSSFLSYAVDYDQDGKRDIWDTQADIFASIANYLKESGWDGAEGWGGKVRLPKDFDTSLADIKQVQPQGYWEKMGIRFVGDTAPPQDTSRSLILVGEGEHAAPYLITNNYKVLLKWNRSRYFATAVGMLADRIGE